MRNGNGPGSASADTATAPIFIGSDIYRSSRHASGHPLAIPRVSLAIDLCRALGWLPDELYRDSPIAGMDDLVRFHSRAYVEAVMRAEARQAVTAADQQTFNLGINGNPVYPEMFRRPATACGASLLAADLLLARPGIVYNPAGGTHHGRPAQASGFCIFNDPVLAILRLLDGGLKPIAYLDLDAHFGDGVQQAFHNDGRVLTISIHEADRWPMARGDASLDRFGGPADRAGGAALNLPVPAGFNDSELAYLCETVVWPAITSLRPDGIVIQAGADALADDPMAKLALSNRALWRVIGRATGSAPRLLVLGGGGYNPWSVARCWAGIWATIRALPVPEALPEEAEALIRSVIWRHRMGRNPEQRWLTTLADPPATGKVRASIHALVETVLRP